MGKPCKEGEIYFAPKGECIPNLNSSKNRYEKAKVAGAALGSTVLGLIIGWLLGKDDDDEEITPAQQHAIQKHDLDDFVPNLDDIDIQYLEPEDIINMSQAITIGTVKRLEAVEDEDEFDSLFFDLEELQNFIEQRAIDEDVYDSVAPIVNHIQDITQIMNHFGNAPDSAEYLGGKFNE